MGGASLAERPAHRLPGGEPQRLALAWAPEPVALFLDEPAADLDLAATRAVEAIVATIPAGATRMVMTSHDLPQARRLAGDIVFLHQGRVLEHAAAAAFLAASGNPEAAAFLRSDLPW